MPLKRKEIPGVTHASPATRNKQWFASWNCGERGVSKGKFRLGHLSAEGEESLQREKAMKRRRVFVKRGLLIAGGKTMGMLSENAYLRSPPGGPRGILKV